MNGLYFSGRDNVYGFVCIDQQSAPVDLSISDRAEIEIGGLTLNSINNSDVIEMVREPVMWRSETQELWVIKLWLGRTELAPGRYSARVVIYAEKWPNGLVVQDGLVVEIAE